METEQRCIVRMQVVVDANVEMLPWSQGDNAFRTNLAGSIACVYTKIEEHYGSQRMTTIF